MEGRASGRAAKVGLFLVGPGRQVRLPRLPVWLVPHLCASLTPAETELAFSARLLPIASARGKTYAAADSLALSQAREMDLRIIARVDGEALGHALTHRFGKDLLRQACFGLARQQPGASAARIFRPGQKRQLLLLLILLAGLFAVAPVLAPAIGAALIFLPLAALRFLSLLRWPQRLSRARIRDADLPVYSVLVALHREAEVLPQLISALSALDYPASRLDVKLVTEADDAETMGALGRLQLPGHFEVITVPPAHPRTKPKALNYALAFTRGGLVTIYDAEDIPDPRQLRQAAELFAAAGPEVACLQARLCFYNAGQNWLTRQFALEYAALFDLLLPMLSALRWPVPLGGTSNHFRKDALMAVGGWDPFNVTEDADLGLRLARAGFVTRVLASSTREEAPISLASWIPQRTRWLKGWLQTWAVQMRDPIGGMRSMGFAAYLCSHVLMIGTFLAALLYPLLTAKFLWSIASGSALGRHAGVLDVAALAANVSVFVLGHGLMMAAAAEGARLRLPKAGLIIASMPAYWILMSVAAWLAIWQFIRAPFHWNKTPHAGMKREAIAAA